MGTATNSLPVMTRNKALSLKRIGWLYPIFRDLHCYHGPLAPPSPRFSPATGRSGSKRPPETLNGSGRPNTSFR